MTASSKASTEPTAETPVKVIGVRGTLPLPFGWATPVVFRMVQNGNWERREFAIWTPPAIDWIGESRFQENVEEGLFTQIQFGKQSEGFGAFLTENTEKSSVVYFDADRLAEWGLKSVTEGCLASNVPVSWEVFRHPTSGHSTFAALCLDSDRDRIRSAVAGAIRIHMTTAFGSASTDSDEETLLNAARVWVDVAVTQADAVEAITYAATMIQRTKGAIQLQAWLNITCQRWPISASLGVWQDRIHSLLAKWATVRFEAGLTIAQRSVATAEVLVRPLAAGEILALADAALRPLLPEQEDLYVHSHIRERKSFVFPYGFRVPVQANFRELASWYTATEFDWRGSRSGIVGAQVASVQIGSPITLQVLASKIIEHYGSDSGKSDYLQLIVETTKRLLHGCASSVLLKVDGKDELRVAAEVCERPRFSGTLTIPFGKGLCGTSAIERRALVASDVSQSSVFYGLEDQFPAALQDVKSEACAPIMLGGRLLGVLNVDSDKVGWFGPNDSKVRMLEMLANEVASVLYWRSESADARAVYYADVGVTQKWHRRVLEFLRSPHHVVVGSSNNDRSLPRGEVGELVAYSATFYLNDLIHDSMHLFDQIAVANMIHFSFDLADTCSSSGAVGRQIQVDKMAFLLIVQELVGNAIRALPDGGDITVKTNANTENATLSIIDCRVGVPDELQASIMNDLAPTQGSLGVGLCWVKHLVKLYGGKLGVYFNVEVGATFTVEFPVSRG